MTHSKKLPFSAFVFYTLFAAGLCLVYAFRGRSFWLDESFIIDFLLTKNPIEVLFAGTLPHMQSFPRIYLMMIDLWHTLQPDSVFWARLLPFIFGVSGFLVWLVFFYDHFWVQKKNGMAFIVAGGLLLANTHLFYYAYELKQYSAEVFFSGFLFALFYTKSFPINVKQRLFGLAALLSLFFSYATLFILFSLFVATVFHPDERIAWIRSKRRVSMLFGAALIILVINFLIDIRPGLEMKGTMTLYWQNFMGGGEKSILSLFKEFLTGWWKTEYGMVNETMLDTTSWKAWPIKIIQNADFRNVLFYGTLVLMIKSFWLDRQSPLFAGAVLFLLMLNLAHFNIYPLGPIRLSLFALPICLLFLVHTILFIEAILERIPLIHKVRVLVWIPFLILIVRNGAYVTQAFAAGPFRENIQEAYRRVDPLESKLVVISKGNEVIAKANPKPPTDLQVIYESQLAAMTIDLNRPIYYLWAHVPPDLNEEKVPKTFDGSHTAQPIFTPKKEQYLGLLLLRPK